MVCLGLIDTMSSIPGVGEHFDFNTFRDIPPGEEHTQGKSKDPVNYYVYQDFSRCPPDRSETALESLSAHTDASIKNQRLPTKLNAMLSDPECSHIISWMPHGRAWRILKPKLFVSEVLPKYFESCNYGSFVRLVNAWGFRRFSSGPDRHAYYHELFLRGLPHLHYRMRRKVWKKNDPVVDKNNEPDLYAVSREHPLPDPDPLFAGLMDDQNLNMMQQLGSSRNNMMLTGRSMAMHNSIAGMGRVASPLFGATSHQLGGLMDQSSFPGLRGQDMPAMGQNPFGGINDVICGQLSQPQRSLDSLLCFNGGLDTYRPSSMNSINQQLQQASSQLQATQAEVNSMHAAQQLQAAQFQNSQHFSAHASPLRSAQKHSINRVQDQAVLSLLYSGYGADDPQLGMSEGNKVGSFSHFPEQTNSFNSSSRTAELRRLLAMRGTTRNDQFFEDDPSLDSMKKTFGARMG